MEKKTVYISLESYLQATEPITSFKSRLIIRAIIPFHACCGLQALCYKEHEQSAKWHSFLYLMDCAGLMGMGTYTTVSSSCWMSHSTWSRNKAMLSRTNSRTKAAQIQDTSWETDMSPFSLRGWIPPCKLIDKNKAFVYFTICSLFSLCRDSSQHLNGF